MSDIKYKTCEHCGGTGKLPNHLRIDAPLHKHNTCAACGGTGKRPVK